MKVLLLILAVIYCIDGHALRKNNGLRPAKRAVDEQSASQVNSDSYSIHKSREISKSAYLPPAIRDLPQTSEQLPRQGITQLKPVSTKLTSISQLNSNIPTSSNQFQAGFTPVSNAFGAPVREQQSSLIQRQSQHHASSTGKRQPHEQYGIPPAFSQSQSHSNSGYQSNVPSEQHGSAQRSQSLHQSIQQQQRTNTEAIFTQQHQQSHNEQHQSYQAPGYLPPSNEEVVPQTAKQQQPYEAPGYLPPSREDIAPQVVQSQSNYEAPGYLPPSRTETTSGILTTGNSGQQHTHEEVIPQAQQNSQSGYSYQHNNEQILPQISDQHQSGYAYNKQTQQQLAGQAQEQSQTQSGYAYQQTKEQILPEAISSQTQTGYSHQQSHEEVAPQAAISQQSQRTEAGYSYQQSEKATQQQLSSSSVASSNPILPLPSYSPSRAPYQHQQSIGAALNNPRPLTSYDPPPSGIPEGLIQPQDGGLSIIREPEGPQPYDQIQPVYRPQYNNDNGQEGYDYSPPEQKFEDGQTLSDILSQSAPENQNYDVISGPSLDSNNLVIKDDFNVRYQEQQQQHSTQEQQHKHIHPETPSGAIGPVETIRIIDESNRNGQGRSVKTVQIYNEVIPNLITGQQGPKTIKTIRVLDAHSAVSVGGLSSNNNGYLPPEASISPGNAIVESIAQANNGYLPPSAEELKPQTISDNGYLPPPPETLPQIQPEAPTIHQLLPPHPHINTPEISQNNGYLPPVGDLHSSIASSQPIREETNNGYLPPPPSVQDVQQQNNGYLPPVAEVSRQNLHSSVASSQPIRQDTNNGYLPPPPSSIQEIQQQDNSYLPPVEDVSRVNLHSSIASSQPIRQETNNGYLPPPPNPIQDIQQNNGYLPPIGEAPRINSHSSISSSQPVRQETNNGYLPPPPSLSSQEPQNNGYLPPIENPPSNVLNVHQLLPPLPELPKSHSHNEILGEPQTNNGYLPPLHQHEGVLPTAVQELQNNGQYQAPGYLPPVPETPPVPIPFQQEISPPLPSLTNSAQYQAPGYLPPHSELSELSSTNNGYLPPASNSIESLAQQSIRSNVQSLPLQSIGAQQQSSRADVKVLRIIHEKKQRPITLPQQQQIQQQQQQIPLPSLLRQQPIIQTKSSSQPSISDQQAIYAAAGQAVNSNVKTIRIIHERTAKTLQGRYGNSKTYLPPSIRVIRVFKKK